MGRTRRRAEETSERTSLRACAKRSRSAQTRAPWAVAEHSISTAGATSLPSEHRIRAQLRSQRRGNVATATTRPIEWMMECFSRYTVGKSLCTWGWCVAIAVTLYRCCRTVQKVSSKKKARRITPTPVGLQTSFSSSFSATGSGSWAENPAFTSSPVLTPSSAQPQREDRRLLQQQLQRRQKTLGTVAPSSLNQKSTTPSSLSQESALPTSSDQKSATPTFMSQESAPPTQQVQGSPLLPPCSDAGDLLCSSVADESQSRSPLSTASPAVQAAVSVGDVTHRTDLDDLADKYSSALLG